MKRKKWKKILRDRRSRKYNKKRKRKSVNHSYKNKYIEEKNVGSSLYTKITSKEYEAPTTFSLIENTDETIGYFNEIHNDILRKIHGASFLIDSSKVEYVTVDALIYLIAIIENLKLIKTEGYKFKGNFPINEKAKKVFIESGFIEYVSSRARRLPNKSRMKILSGTKNLPTISKMFCDFIVNELNWDRKRVIFVQKILVELMSNAYYHAYNENKNEEMFPKWYIYAEHIDNKIRIIFADTGKGITGTVRRKFTERVFGMNDEELLSSAFEPDNFIRTETKQKHRGNGLPGIKDVIKDSPITAFWVFSGKGAICIDSNNNLTKSHFQNKIRGTIISFEFKGEN